MRLCGHAHHDDMLYLGRDPQTSWEIPPLTGQGYANRELYEYWAARDPIKLYAARLTADGILGPGDLDRFKAEAEAIVATGKCPRCGQALRRNLGGAEPPRAIPPAPSR